MNSQGESGTRVTTVYAAAAAAAAIALGLLISAAPAAQASGDIVYWIADAPLHGAWRLVSDASAAGGRRVEQPNLNAPRLTTPLASPTHYIDIPVTVEANRAYHLWLRGRAYANSGENDSVWVQTSGTVDASGAPIYRIGTASGTWVSLEDCRGCPISGWVWQDNGFGAGVSGALLTFATAGPKTIRIQAREDGISLDQLVLSPVTYLTAAPGASSNDTTILPRTGATTPPAVTLVRGPYLHQPGATSIVVVWATREAGSASVLYRTGSDAYSTAAATSVFRATSVTGLPDYYQHEATLTGLRPGTTYQYDLRLGAADPTPTTVDQFRTAPAPGTGTIRFIAFGDSGNGSTAQQQVASAIAADTFDLGIHTGDIAYSTGTYAQFENYFFPYYRNWLRRVGVLPSIGNHDNATGSAGPYRALFALPRDGATAAYPNNAERFYSADVGPVHFIALDTEAAFLSAERRAEQLAWLEADLQGAQGQPWRIVFFHRPPYNSGVEHGSDLAVRQAFGPLFERYHVQFAITGHEHHYERSVPWRESTDTTRQAVTYVVTGGGGATLYGTGRSAWTAYSRSVHHYVRGIVSATDVTLEAVSTSGTVLDRFVLNLAQQETDAAPPTVSISSPAAQATLSGTETIEAIADDDRRVEKVDLWIDGRQRSIDLTSPYAFSLDTRTLANGAHQIEVRAYDIDGRRASAVRSVTVAN